MLTRPPGATGIDLPALGFGASPLGGVFGEVSADECRRAVQTALELGLNYFDTSPYYGLTRSERMLGRALAGVPRESFLLSTKVGRYGQNDFDFSAGRVERSLRESQDRLGVETFDIVFCHDIEFGDSDQIVGETLPALEAARDAGLVRYTGISGLPLALLKRVADAGRPDVVLTYCRYTLFNTDLNDSVAFFAGRGVSLINAAPLGMGLLSRQGPPDWHPAAAGLRRACREASELCDAKGIDIADVALAFALGGPAACALTGMSRADEVRRNAARLRSDGPAAEILDEVRGLFHNLPEGWPRASPDKETDRK